MTDLQWGRLSNDAFNVALFAYIVAMVGYFAYLAFRRTSLWAVARTIATAGLVANVVCVVTRGLAAHRVPWGNMYEYSVLLALLVVAGYLLIVEGHYKVRTPRRVRADVLRAHHGDRRVVPLRGARSACPGAQLVLDQDPRGRRDQRAPRCSRSAAACSPSCS